MRAVSSILWVSAKACHKEKERQEKTQMSNSKTLPCEPTEVALEERCTLKDEEQATVSMLG